MSQRINLNRYLGRDSTEAQRIMFAELAVEQINQRTLDGDTIHGTRFKKYSKTYAEVKGVARDSVDLFLDGDMLDSVSASPTGNGILIELEAKETPKGFNHQTGDTLPKRQWFGITTIEAQRIAEAVQAQDPQAENQGSFTLTDLQQALNVLGLEQDG